jgi:hypothetical protein
MDPELKQRRARDDGEKPHVREGTDFPEHARRAASSKRAEELTEHQR